MSKSYLATKSLAFRANLAQLVSPLRRVRSKTPFFKLPAHRVPTLWSLYRGLLRNAPTEDVKFRIRVLFQKKKGSTGVECTVTDLKQGYKWLDFFRKAKEGDEHHKAVMERYCSMIVMKREKSRMMRLAREEIEWQAKLRHRPILTGGFMRPTLDHGPLPRMKPQPPAISHLIIQRIKKRDERHNKRLKLEDNMEDLETEQKFEEGLQWLTKVKFEKLYADPDAKREWKAPIDHTLELIRKSQRHEYARSEQSFSPELMERILEARREKIRNKTRERERERRGELTKSALKRQRKEPPAHILANMTPEQREMDRKARSMVEVGSVALAKHRLGFKLKNPDAALELGEKQNRPLLDKALEFIRAENARREKIMEKEINKLESAQPETNKR